MVSSYRNLVCVYVDMYEKRVITCLKFCTLTLDPSFPLAKRVCVCVEHWCQL